MKSSYRATILSYPKLIVGVQVLLHLLVSLPAKLFIRVKSVWPAKLNGLHRGTLLVANHQSLADPFLVTAHIPFFQFIRLLPIYFPVDHEWMKRPILGFFLRLFGSYSVGETRREKMLALFYTSELLRRRETIFLFPEGKISKSSIEEFQRGIEYFIRASQSIILVRMEGFHPKKNGQKPAPKKIIFDLLSNHQEMELDAEAIKQLVESLGERKENEPSLGTHYV